MGYQVKGTFLGFQTSGELFERFTKEVKEKMKLDIKAVGTIRVDEIYAVAPPEPGKKIASSHPVQIDNLGLSI